MDLGAAGPYLRCLTDAAQAVTQPGADVSRIGRYAGYIAQLSALVDQGRWDVASMDHEDWVAVLHWRAAIAEAHAERAQADTERARHAERARRLTGLA